MEKWKDAQPRFEFRMRRSCGWLFPSFGALLAISICWGRTKCSALKLAMCLGQPWGESDFGLFLSKAPQTWVPHNQSRCLYAHLFFFSAITITNYYSVDLCSKHETARTTAGVDFGKPIHFREISTQKFASMLYAYSLFFYPENRR